MKNNNIKLYISIAVFALAIFTTLPQLFHTLKGLCIYVPYFTILCTPAILVLRRKLQILHASKPQSSVSISAQ